MVRTLLHKNSPMDGLTDDCILCVLFSCDIGTLLSLLGCSSYMRKFMAHEHLWKMLYVRDYPEFSPRIQDYMLSYRMEYKSIGTLYYYELDGSFTEGGLARSICSFGFHPLITLMVSDKGLVTAMKGKVTRHIPFADAIRSAVASLGVCYFLGDKHIYKMLRENVAKYIEGDALHKVDTLPISSADSLGMYHTSDLHMIKIPHNGMEYYPITRSGFYTSPRWNYRNVKKHFIAYHMVTSLKVMRTVTLYTNGTATITEEIGNIRRSCRITTTHGISDIAALSDDSIALITVRRGSQPMSVNVTKVTRL